MKRIDKYRSSFFLLAIAVTLGLANLAFNYTFFDQEAFIEAGSSDNENEEVEIVRTAAQKKKIIPPPPEPIIEPDAPDNDPDYEPIDEDPDTEPSPIDSTSLIDSTMNNVTQSPSIGVVSAPPKVEPKKDISDDAIYEGFGLEKMPFMGDCYSLEAEEQKICFEKTFKTFLAKRIKYPKFAQENGIEGTVVVQFIVSKTGHLVDFDVVRDIGGGCGAEAIRVFKTMPAWSPGIQNGRPVNVRFTAPVKFDLQ